MLQSARSVWRQSPTTKLPIPRLYVAICTERVEAKGKVIKRIRLDYVAICTERVEAKGNKLDTNGVLVRVAICTERVEAKP